MILITLTVADLIFQRKLRKVDDRAGSEFFAYEMGVPADLGMVGYFGFVLLKISPAFLITLIWAAAHASQSKIIKIVYAGLLGFAISIYLIVNLRHIESLLTDYLIQKRRKDLSGRVTIKRRFLLGQTAVRILSLFVMLAFIALIRPSPLFIGFALAPLVLVLRYWILAKP